MELRYWILLICLGAVWGSAFIFIKIATPEFGAIPLVQARLFIASLIFLPVLLQPKYLALLKPIWKHTIVLAVTNNAIPFTMFSLASFGSDSNMLAILNATTAFNTMIIAYFWLNETVSLKQLFGLILGFIGVIILVNPESSTTSISSAIFCLMGASCYAFSTVFIQKNSAKTHKLVLIGWSVIIGGIILLPFTLMTLPETIPSNNSFYAVLWLGGISTGLAFLGYVRLIEKIGAVKTSTVAYFLPVFGILWGYLFLDEIITLNVIVGCTTVLIGVFLATSKKITKYEGKVNAT
tara:strand:+ start:6115 stop:6996 length:882 start_codon:yes stop_codon:yes gene_type:complete